MSYPADLLGFALRESSSPFQKALVDSGACVQAGFDWSSEMTVGPISLRFEAEPEKVDGCAQAALEEIPKMSRPDYLNDQDMANAAHSAEVERVLAREKPSEYSHLISFWWATAGLGYYEGYVENLRKVTRADVARFFDTYVIGKPFVFGVLLSPEIKKDRRLDSGHFEQLLQLKARGAAQGAQ
jgi:hypothetical protein